MLIIDKDRKTRTVVICPVAKTESLYLSAEDMQNRLDEIAGLVLAMGQIVVWSEVIKSAQIISGTYLGKGTIERLRKRCESEDIELLVFDGVLSPVQQRNLEKELNIKVIDRTAVILEIFGQRAQTKEGKLQVELAHLTYQRGRLVRSWTHLERQRGGGGFLGGPGETQIELDRRRLDERIVRIKKELEKVKRTRAIQRSARERVPYPIVALVGYTNAGKSTLFNMITKSDVMAKDMLFATLDPTMRKYKLTSGIEVIFSDTVGFIANLPHELVMAFRATLEEVLEADVILHVIDVSNPQYKTQREDVIKVLHELGLDKIEYAKNYIEVYNKTDLLNEKSPIQEKARAGVSVSALTGYGVNELLLKINDFLLQNLKIKKICLTAKDGDKLAEIYRTAEVLERREDEDKIYLCVRYFK